jgi:hypothetical protein
MSKLFFVLSGFLLIFAVLFYLRSSPTKNPVQDAEKRATESAQSQFDKNVKVCEEQRKAGQITDVQFARCSANERGLLESRLSTAQNPTSGICESPMENEGGGVREYPLPSRCDSGYTFPVWPDGPKKVLKVEFVTAKGGLVLQGSPKLFAGNHLSTAKPLGNNRWEVEGSVSYRHEHAEDDMKLRVTVENQ